VIADLLQLARFWLCRGKAITFNATLDKLLFYPIDALISTDLKQWLGQQLLILITHVWRTKHQADIQMLYDLCLLLSFHHLPSQDPITLVETFLSTLYELN
jgi:hypothetical protein